MKYRVLYLPTGEYIKNGFYDDAEKPMVFDSEESAFQLVVSMSRQVKPPHSGFMEFNGIIFPSLVKHFHLVEDA